MNFEYNPDMNEDLESENLEKTEQLENELSLIEKQYLTDNWKNKVIDGVFNIDNNQINNKELKEILSKSLLEDIAELSNEWGIELDRSLPEEECIERMRIQMNDLAKKPEGDTHWDSWPKK